MTKKLSVFIPAKKETVIGGFDLLDNYILRTEKSDAIPRLLVRNIDTNDEEELIVSEEPVGSPGFSLMQKNTNTTKIRISWDRLSTRSYLEIAFSIHIVQYFSIV